MRLLPQMQHHPQDTDMLMGLWAEHSLHITRGTELRWRTEALMKGEHRCKWKYTAGMSVHMYGSDWGSIRWQASVRTDWRCVTVLGKSTRMHLSGCDIVTLLGHSNFCAQWAATCNPTGPAQRYITYRAGSGRLCCMMFRIVGSQCVLYEECNKLEDSFKWTFGWCKIHLFFLTVQWFGSKHQDEIKWQEAETADT